MRSIAGPTFRHNSGSFQETVKLQAVAEAAKHAVPPSGLDHALRSHDSARAWRWPIAAGYIGQSSNLRKSNAARQSTLNDARCVRGLGRKFATATYTL
jgi:hypothetical protein